MCSRIFVSAGAGLIALLLLAGLAAGAPRSLGPGSGILIDNGQRDSPCGMGNVFMNTDGTYEDAFAWDGGGVAPPDWGAFAECFWAPEYWELCGLVFDLTTTGGTPHYTGDAFIWEYDQGAPGGVLAVVTGFDPNPVAQWPQISRTTVDLVRPMSGGRFFAGYWGNWPGFQNYLGWYVAVDSDFPGSEGCPYTHVLAGTGYPTGWQNVSAVWFPVSALGIGVYGHYADASSTPGPAENAQNQSWGRVKSLYQ